MELGRDKITVSHLQCVDDTILLRKASLENALIIRRVLVLFQLLSDLHVNYKKCRFTGVNVDQGLMQEMVVELRCDVGSIPFTYFDLKVGMFHKKEVK